jgi:hypothetical protein
MRLARLAAAAAVAAVLLPAPAHADADPASDVLLAQDVFLPFFGGKASDSSADYLNDVVTAANDSGFQIKVAAIGSRGDLGGVFTLFGKPKRYAPFLGREITFQYVGRLLVSMPQGFGFFWQGHDTQREQRLLATVPIKPGADGLVESSADAVKKLAAADGHPIDVQRSGSSSSSARIVIGVVGGLVLAAVIAAPLLLRRRRRAPA